MGIVVLVLLLGIGALEAQENSASLYPSPSQLPRARVGVRYSVTFTPSPAQAYQWTIGGSAPGLEFSGGDYARTLSGIPLQSGSFSITVRFERLCAADSAPPCHSVTSQSAYTLQVGGSIAILNAALPDGRVGVDYFAVLQQSGGTGAVSWSASGLPAGLVLRNDVSAGAVLAGRPTRTGIYAVMLRLHDATGESATRTFPLVVTSSSAPSLPPDDRPAVVSDALLPDASVGAPFEATLAARGGSPPHRFALRSSTLPPGLAMNELGRISGTPLRQGAFQFDVVATDSAAVASPAKTFLVDVFGAVRLQASHLPPAVERRAYSARLRAAGGVKPYEWSAVGLPGGLRIVPSSSDPSSAEILGAPDAPTGTGGAQVTIDVRDRNGLSDRRLLRLVVTDNTLRVVTAALPRGATGQFYSLSLAIAGGVPPYTCSLAPSVGLPPDLRLSPNGCVIAGVPRIGTNQTIEIIARDSAGATATARLLLSVESPDLRITTNTLPQPTEGTPLAPFQLQAEGGSGQYLWSATGLPGGMRVSPEGVLSGTAFATGTLDAVTFTVTDRNRRDDVRSQVFSMTVRPRGSVTILTSAALGTALLDQQFRQPLAATGGRTPYRWTLAAAAPAQPTTTLPPGLFLDPDTGAITGRPFQAGIYRFLVRAADIDGENEVREFDLTVDLPLEVRVTEQPDFLVTGETGRVQLQASASDPSRVEYSLAAEVAGVSIDRRTGLITVRAGQPGDLAIEAAASDGTQRTPVHIAIRVIEALNTRAALLPPGTVPELPADAPRALLPDLTATLNGGRTTQSVPTDVSLELPTAPPSAAPQLVAGSRTLDGSVEEGSIRWTGAPLEGTGPFGQTSLLFRNVPARLLSVDGAGFRQNVGVTMVAGPARASAAVAVVARNGVEFSVARDRIIIQELIKDAFRHSSVLSVSLPEGALPVFDDSQIAISAGAIEVLRHDPAQFDRIEIGLITDPLAPPSISLIEAGFAGSDRRQSLVFSTGALVRNPARNRYGVPIAPGGLATVEFRDPAPIAEATITSDAPLPELGGLRLRLTDAQGNAHAAGLLSVSPREVLFVVPQAAVSGLASIAVESSADGAVLAQAATLVAPVAPGLFSADASGSGPARGRLLRFSGATEAADPLSFFDESEGRWLHVPIEAPAAGERLFLRLDATGLRNRSDLARVYALAGVQALNVISAGQSTDAAFLDSILLEIPPALHGAGVVEVRIAVDGIESNAVTIQH